MIVPEAVQFFRTSTGLRYVAFTVTGPDSNKKEVRVGVIETATWLDSFIAGPGVTIPESRNGFPSTVMIVNQPILFYRQRR